MYNRLRTRIMIMDTVTGWRRPNCAELDMNLIMDFMIILYGYFIMFGELYYISFHMAIYKVKSID